MFGFAPVAAAPIADDAVINITNVTPSNVVTGAPVVDNFSVTVQH